MRYKLLAVICIGFILWFTIQPVEMSWTETDVRLTEVIGGVAVVAVLMLLWRRRQTCLSAVDVVVTLWFVYVMLRAYVDPVYPCAHFCLRSMQMFALYIVVRLLLSSVDMTERVLVVGILICAGYEVFVGAGQLLNGTSRHYLYALSGTFLNPGPYSAFLSMGLVMSCQLKKGYWLPAVFLVLLPATWSRAALVSAAVCLGIIYWDQWKRWRWWVFLAAVLALTGLYFLKQGSANGRSIIYLISLLCICQHPVFGSGIGSFCHQYAEGLSSFYAWHPSFSFQSADVTDSAYNSLLQIGVEQGLTGVVITVVLIALLFFKLKAQGKVLGMGLFCLLIFSMFSYPLDLLPYQILFVLISAFAASENKGAVLLTRQHQRYLIPITITCCVIMFSNITYKAIKNRAIAETDYKITAGISHAGFIDNYYSILPLLRNNTHFLFDFGKILSEEKRYNDSNAILCMGTLVSNDPMFYIVQGNNYSEMGFYQEAEQAYLKAFSVMPNRIYPLYRLMLLYKKEGCKAQMESMAMRVVSFNEKIVSPATDEMREKAKEIAYYLKDSMNDL